MKQTGDDEQFYGFLEDTNSPESLICCKHASDQTQFCRICSTFQTLYQEGMDFAVVPLRYPDFSFFHHSPCLTSHKSESGWNKLCVGRLENEIASPTDLKVVEAAAMFSIYHGMRTLLIQNVGHGLLKQLARVINDLMNRHKMSIWYITPWNHWTNWNRLRYMCGHNPLLGVCPALPIFKDEMVAGGQESRGEAKLRYLRRFFGLSTEVDVLSKGGNERISDLWLSEPIRLLYTNTSKSSWTLHTSLDPFLLRRIPLVLHKAQLNEFREAVKKVELQKTNFIASLSQMNTNLLLTTAFVYHDGTPLAPLRPLQENLENTVYEAFEKDPVKYSAYQKAIANAMRQLALNHSELKGRGLRVAILGAGRGPLVRCALAAAQQVGMTIDQLFICEKNEWACWALRQTFARVNNSDGSAVRTQVIEGDFRTWKPMDAIDLAVSELLGSFGCNEASPECLSTVLPAILGKHGLSIPQNYSSFIVPVQASKTHESLLQLSEKSKTPGIFERLHVVNLRDTCLLGTPQLCFGFDHSGVGSECQREMEPNRSRFCSLTFTTTGDGVIHGLAGQFDCKLFGQEKLSTVEGQRSPGLLSWFSTYFPIRNPIFIQQNEKFIVNIWRVSTKAKLWYEWNIDEPLTTEISNSGGKCDFLDLS